jgi:rSAM/selenodomain-associated transferase 1
MARAPSDPLGKTRLVGALAPDDAVLLRRAILLDTLDVARQLSTVDVFVVFMPDDARDEMNELAPDVAGLVPQRGETLGERMEGAFSDLFARPYEGVALIGSDIPTVPPAYLLDGMTALMRKEDPVVLGASQDGGYYFIAMRRLHRQLFASIPWSTDRVLAATIAAAADEGLATTILPQWYDIDSAADLRRALTWSDGSSLPGRASYLRAWGRRRSNPGK